MHSFVSVHHIIMRNGKHCVSLMALAQLFANGVKRIKQIAINIQSKEL